MNEEQINFYYVSESPLLIQRKCKEFGASTIVSFMVGILIVSLIMNWIPDILSVYFTTSYWDILGDRLQLTAEQRAALPELPLISVIYPIIFSGVIQLGKCLYSLTYIRNNKSEYGAIFEGFKVFPKAFLLFLVMMLIISLLAMLFLIPGIIAYYSFSQSFYILADDPEKGVLQCLAESKLRMRGNRLALFRVQLSYAPILLLCYLPIILVAYFTNIDYSTLGGTLIGIATEIPFFCGVSLLVMGEAVFYELLIQGGFAKFKYAAQDAFRK